MKIAYITTYDLSARHRWPQHAVGIRGAGVNIAAAFTKQDATLVPLMPRSNRLLAVLLKGKTLLYRYAFRRKFFHWLDLSISKQFSSDAAEKLMILDVEMALCPENAGPIAFLKCKQPIVLWTDSTWGGLIDFYPFFTDLCAETLRNIHSIEKSAFDRCALLIFTSEWAAQSAITTYGVDPTKVKVVPWGSYSDFDKDPSGIEKVINLRRSTPCKLLFIGPDWHRKGGDIAVQVAEKLHREGLEVELTLVGVKPQREIKWQSFIKRVGFINKFSEEGHKKMSALLYASHFLIAPSRADCTPFVLSEANACGVPCIATRVGGIPSIIRDGINGKTFALDASVSDYCSYIRSVMADPQRYRQLARSSFREYQTRLNWDVVVGEVRELMKGLLCSR